jgi:hypothetical protein
MPHVGRVEGAPEEADPGIWRAARHVCGVYGRAFPLFRPGGDELLKFT